MTNKEKYKVNISDSTIEQIYHTLKYSNIEEGGKLIGTINMSRDCTEINVQSYIDSGLKSDKSATHLFPDWNYQEKIFRILELFDNNIYHIGTWHSHHCNGLKTLSSGDIKGYFADVNNSNYLVDYFLAILVTDLRSDNLFLKYYLFIKGEVKFIEINNRSIHKVKLKNNVTQILELTNNLCHPNNSANANHITSLEQNHEHSINSLNEIRVIDNKWLRQSYSDIVTKRNKFTNVISWHWFVNFRNDRMKFVYSHPPFLGKIRKVASLKVFLNNNRIKKVKIPLNGNRFRRINYVFNQIFGLVN